MQLSHADRNHPTLSHIAQNLVLPRPLPKLMISTVLAGWVSSLPLHDANLEYKIAIFVSEPPTTATATPKLRRMSCTFLVYQICLVN